MSFLILPTRELAEELQSSFEDWLQQRSLSLEKPIELEMCVQIVHDLVYENVDNSLQWIRFKEMARLENTVVRVCPEIGLAKLFDFFYIDILDAIDIQISTMVRNFVPENTWNIFHYRKLGADLMIERGEDYRIVDWQRRFDAGEFSLES